MKIAQIYGFRPVFKAKYDNINPNNENRIFKGDTFELSKENNNYENDKYKAKLHAKILQYQAQLYKEDGEELHKYYTEIINDVEKRTDNPNILANYDKKAKTWYIKTFNKDGNVTSWMLYDKQTNNMAIGNLLNGKPIVYSFDNNKLNRIEQKSTPSDKDFEIIYSLNNDKDYTISIPIDEDKNEFSCSFINDELISASELKAIYDDFGLTRNNISQSYVYKN